MVMKKKVLFFSLLFISIVSFAQVGVGTSSPSDNAILDLTSTSKGLLPPRLTNAEALSLAVQLASDNQSEDIGMVIYDTDNKKVLVWDGAAFSSLSTKDDYYASSYVATPATMLTSLSGGQVSGESVLRHSNGFASVTNKTELVYAGLARIFLMNVSISFRPETASSGFKTFDFYVIKRNSNGTEHIVGSDIRTSLDLSNPGNQAATITTSIELDALDIIEIHVKGNSESIVIDNLQINLR